MKKYSNYILSKGGNELGVTYYDIQNHILTPAEWSKFLEFMNGQTVGCIDDSYHTSVVYTGDLERFLKDLPCID
jgi:hypothetical protein